MFVILSVCARHPSLVDRPEHCDSSCRDCVWGPDLRRVDPHGGERMGPA